MANEVIIKKGTIKRKNGANTEVMYPKTTIDQVIDLNASLSAIATEIGNKITDPETKSTGNFLKYDGSAWVAADVPESGVLSVTGTDGIKVTGTSAVTVGIGSEYKLPTTTEWEAKADVVTVNAIASRVSAAETDIINLQASVSTQATAIASVQAAVSTAEASIKSLGTSKQDKFNDGEAIVATVSDGVITINDKVDQSSGTITSGTSIATAYTVAAIDTKVSSIYNAISGKQDKFDDGSAKVADLTAIGTSTTDKIITIYSVAQASGKIGDGASVDQAYNKAKVDTEVNRLDARIDSLESRGRYLSGWNCVTGKPITDPTSLPYTYRSGDYYIVSTIDTEEPITNYKPDGSSYTGAASTVVETDANVAVGDTYTYDGTNWILQHNTVNNQRVKAGSVTFGANDEVDFIGGSNVTVVGDAEGTKITISAVDTTYTATDGIKIESNVIKHINSVASVGENSFVKLKYDEFGHVTGSTAVVESDITGLIGDKYVEVAGDTMTGNLTFDNTKGVILTGGGSIYSTASGIDVYASNGKSVKVASGAGNVDIIGNLGVNITSGAGSVIIESGTTAKIDNILVPHGTTGKTFATTDYVSASASGSATTNAKYITINGTEWKLGDVDKSYVDTELSKKIDKVASTDNAIVRFDGSTGIVQNSSAKVDDNGRIIAATGTSGGFTFGLNNPGVGYITRAGESTGDTLLIHNYGNIVTEAISASGSAKITVGAGEIKFDAVTTTAGSGYAKMPINDGSSSDNYYTVATREWANNQGWVKTSGVTSVTAGVGLDGGEITSTGTISLATTGVAAGTYSACQVDAYGRVMSGGQILDVISAGGSVEVVDGGWYFEENAA